MMVKECSADFAEKTEQIDPQITQITQISV
jgi:hypothetical protein